MSRHDTDDRPPARMSYHRLRTPHLIGAAIRNARRDAGMTQAELAQLSRVNRTSIALIENGQRNVSCTTLQRLLDPLGYDISIHHRERDAAR
ncbi:helix-turn-helix domain-containing protein [Candidatus Poriferisodalis sp.]|uniref:helix-turn-helix domain-containing protein n=1 Tax=Candidatus Poriferisodalis sp. TaxID=3101277 RepID=UPI003B02DB67